MKGCYLSTVFSVVLLLCLLVRPAAAADLPPTVVSETTVLFTHDLHSHFTPVETEDGGESGGYARLKTWIDCEKEAHPNALLLDGGDFSIGSLIQTLYTTQAAELRTMGAMGYDATTIGNHEFDHKGVGFAQMLRSATESGDTLPSLLCANYTPASDDPNYELICQAMEEYGVQDSMLLERGGVTYGIFGLMGKDSHDCAPTSGFVLEDTAIAAERCVSQLKEQGAEFIICLSHSGTDANVKKSEDEQLAKNVAGIDLIVSGHTHTTLDQPIVVGNTYIVSAGQYGENLGSITLQRMSDGSLELTDYRLIPIDEKVVEEGDIAALIEEWKAMVGETYLYRYGLTYDQVLTTTTFDLDTPRYGVQENNTLGMLVSDAFSWAMEHLAAEKSGERTVAVTADGVLRAALHSGAITTDEAFDVLSMGVGEDGTSGFPLVAVYLTGKEIKAAMEVDASVTPIMPAAQLYLSGVSYSFNTHRMFFNRVTESAFADGEPIQDDALYRVVTGMYSAQMLGTVKSKSMGLLSLEPKNAQGEPITDFSAYVVYDENGNELKEWYALAAYLRQFGEDGVDLRYAEADNGSKQVDLTWNPVTLLKHPNGVTIGALSAVLLAVLLAIWVFRRKKS